MAGAGSGSLERDLAVTFLDNIADPEGEEVAVIVVAESEELCDEALRQLQVEWEVLPHILDPRQGKKPDAPIIQVNPKGKQTNVDMATRNEGDIEAGFKQADQIIEFDWNLSYFSSHVPNPYGGVAWWYDDPLSSEGKNLRLGSIGCRFGFKSLHWSSDVPLYVPSLDC